MRAEQLQETTQLQNRVNETITNKHFQKSSTVRSLPKAPTQNAYILGPGDAVVVELLDIPEYSGVFTIGPDGHFICRGYVPYPWRGSQSKSCVTSSPGSVPTCATLMFVTPAAYRPIRVYIGGEVARPGYYYLSGAQASWTRRDTTNPAIGIFEFAGRANSSRNTIGSASRVGPASMATR